MALPSARRRLLRLSAAVLSCLLPVFAALGADPVAGWRPLWSVSLATAEGAGPIYANQTIRQVVHASAAGSTLRLRLSQRYGSNAIGLTAVSIGIRAQGAAIRPGTLRPVNFGGRRMVTLGGGQALNSDPISLAVGQFDDLVISYTVASYVSQITRHAIARQRAYVSSTAGAVDDIVDGSYRQATGANETSFLLIEAVEAQTTAATRTLVVAGDSNTDGYISANGSTLSAETARLGLNERFPDFLARRLAAALPDTYTVVNAGIGGNRVNAPPQFAQYGPSLLDRLQQDVLAVGGVTDVIVSEGVNDLGIPNFGYSPDPDALIVALSQVVGRLKAANLRVLLATLLPVRGAPNDTLGLKTGGGSLYDTAVVEAARQKVNAWIRSQALADGVVDVDACLRNPQAPDQLLAAYDSGDHLHPSPAGYSAMADCVDLDRLR